MIRKSGTALFTAIALLSITSSLSNAESRPLLTHHVREATASGEARFVTRLPADQPMRLVVVLPLRNQAALDQFLKDLYDPASPSYRHFLTLEEFTSRFGPTQQDYETVLRWARTNGFAIAGTSRNRVNIDLKGSVANIEGAFHVNLGLYQHPTGTYSGPAYSALARRWSGQLFDPAYCVVAQNVGSEVPGNDGLVS